MGVAFVRGLQGSDPHYLKIVATPKHFAVHSGPEPGRHGFDVHPSEFDLADTYLPAFRAPIMQGGAASLMCAYNAVDGVPACASSFLLGDTLRRDWGFKGFVVSDCDAVADVSGSAVALNWADKNADGVLAAWYGGERAGSAISETLSGKSNPSGKLPITFCKTLDDLPPFDNYSMAGRTYRYYQGQVLYPFGFGLSYAKFALSDVSVTKPQFQAGENVSISLTISNESKVAGGEVV